VTEAGHSDDRRVADIQAMAVQLARLAVLVETAEKARADDVAERRIMKHDMQTILSTLQSLPLLSEKLSTMSASLTREISDHSSATNKQLADMKTELAKELATLDKQCELNTKDIQDFKTWRAGLDGAAGAYKKVGGWVWALVSSMATLIVSGAIYYIQRYHGGIGGE
jgi:uncharacterized phage infection (PIP) family protein YhgE